jgi:hypothetical protein
LAIEKPLKCDDHPLNFVKKIYLKCFKVYEPAWMAPEILGNQLPSDVNRKVFIDEK